MDIPKRKKETNKQKNYLVISFIFIKCIFFNALFLQLKVQFVLNVTENSSANNISLLLMSTTMKVGYPYVFLFLLINTLNLNSVEVYIVLQRRKFHSSKTCIKLLKLSPHISIHFTSIKVRTILGLN